MGKTNSSKKKIASLVFFYYGDDKFTTFFQETTNLKLAMQKYDYKVLLKHDTVPATIDLVEKDEKIANVKEAPTKKNLIRYLKKLADDKYIIDVWIFAHGAKSGFTASKGKHGSDDWIFTEDIKKLADSTGYKKLPIRMVYQINCYGSYQNSAWLEAGANTSIGSKYVNFYPIQFSGFAKRWNKKEKVFKALDKANTAVTRTAVQSYILVDAAGSRKKWGGCPFGKTVLGKSACSFKYFKWRSYTTNSEWQDSLSGKKNMNYSSNMKIAGNKNLTIDTF